MFKLLLPLPVKHLPIAFAFTLLSLAVLFIFSLAFPQSAHAAIVKRGVLNDIVPAAEIVLDDRYIFGKHPYEFITILGGKAQSFRFGMRAQQ